MIYYGNLILALVIYFAVLVIVLLVWTFIIRTAVKSALNSSEINSQLGRIIYLLETNNKIIQAAAAGDADGVKNPLAVDKFVNQHSENEKQGE